MIALHHPYTWSSIYTTFKRKQSSSLITCLLLWHAVNSFDNRNWIMRTTYGVAIFSPQTTQWKWITMMDGLTNQSIYSQFPSKYPASFISAASLYLKFNLHIFWKESSPVPWYTFSSGTVSTFLTTKSESREPHVVWLLLAKELNENGSWWWMVWDSSQFTPNPHRSTLHPSSLSNTHLPFASPPPSRNPRGM